MLPDPMHPAVVHFPIVLAVLLPPVAAAALIAIRRGARPGPAWAMAVGTAALLALSSWVAVRTGEDQEDAVESVVAEGVLHDHEEAGERFLLLSGIVLVVVAGGLLPGVAGRAARGLGTAAAVALLVAGWQAGHSGGELVYRHGAASAYASTGSVPESAPVAGRRVEERERESASRHDEEDD